MKQSNMQQAIALATVAASQLMREAAKDLNDPSRFEAWQIAEKRLMRLQKELRESTEK